MFCDNRLKVIIKINVNNNRQIRIHVIDTHFHVSTHFCTCRLL